MATEKRAEVSRVNVVTGQSVAINLEANNAPSLEAEVEYFRDLAGGDGIPQVYWAGEADNYYAMVLELLGPREDLFNFCGRRFSLKTVLMTADQILRQIEFVHSKHLIHNDIQPGNLLMGVGRSGNKVYLSDFGLTCDNHYDQIKNYATLKELYSGDSWGLIGYPPFTSPMGHVGGGRCRSDDLESLGYVLVRFLVGSLPWDGLEADNKNEKVKMIQAKKEVFDPSQLGDEVPREIGRYFDSVRSLGLNEKPNYKKLRKFFQDLFVRRGFAQDYGYDWSIRLYALANPPTERREAVEKRTKRTKRVQAARARRGKR